MDAAVGIDDVMIANVVPAEAFMVAANALHGAVGIGAGGGAMDDDFGDGSHFLMGLVGLIGLMGERKGEQADCPRCGRLAELVRFRRQRDREC